MVGGRGGREKRKEVCTCSPHCFGWCCTLQLAHPILGALRDTDKQWLIDLLYAFNSGMCPHVCVSLCACVHVCTYVYVCVCMCTCVYVYVCVCACVHVCTYMCVCTCVHVCTYMCVCVCMCTCVCVFVCTCTCA